MHGACGGKGRGAANAQAARGQGARAGAASKARARIHMRQTQASAKEVALLPRCAVHCLPAHSMQANLAPRDGAPAPRRGGRRWDRSLEWRVQAAARCAV